MSDGGFEKPNLAEVTFQTKQEVKSLLEVTLNLPNYKEYVNLDTSGKFCLYKNIWDDMMRAVDHNGCRHSYNIEYCRNGNPHMHGFMEFEFDHDIFAEGLVMDVVRRFFANIPQRYRAQIRKNPYDTYLKRFRAPAICINYKNSLSHQWLCYMNKNAVVRSDK